VPVRLDPTIRRSGWLRGQWYHRTLQHPLMIRVRRPDSLLLRQDHRGGSARHGAHVCECCQMVKMEFDLLRPDADAGTMCPVW